MKKTWIAILLAALLLAGCAGNRQSSSLPPQSTPDQSSSQETLSPVSDPDFDEMMEALAAYQPGTAGSSLKVYIAACGVLNFSEQFDTSEAEQLQINLEAYLEDADQLAIEAIAAGQADVKSAAEAILDGGAESVKNVLESAGNPNRYNSYSREKYDQVAAILDNVFALYTTV